MSPRRSRSAMVAISVLERTGWMPSSCSAMSSIVWWVRKGSRGSTESKSLWGDMGAVRVGSAGWRGPGGSCRHSHQVGAEAVDEGAEGQAAGPGGGEVGHGHAAVPGRAGLAPAQQLLVGISRDRWGAAHVSPSQTGGGPTPPARSPLPTSAL